MRTITRSACALGLLWLLAGCATSPGAPPSAARLVPLAGISQARWDAAPEPRDKDELLALNDAMREFVAGAVGKRTQRERRIQQLTAAVLHPGSLGLSYNDRATRSAAEAFDTANGNCLSLSMLFVALAREAGIDASFYEVNVVPEWTLAGDIVFATRHINVGGRINRNSTYVMDFSPYIVRREIGRRRLSDDEAMAQYYNNIGAEYLAAGDLPAAFKQFRAGLALAPGISFLWSNLSVVYSRNAQPDAAEQALRVAIGLDEDNTSAMANLAQLLNARGDTEAAANLTAGIEAAQRRNPYFQFALGERHMTEQRFPEALLQIERAIALEPGEPLFYRRAAAAAQQLERPQLAQEYLATAQRLSAEEQERRRQALEF